MFKHLEWQLIWLQLCGELFLIKARQNCLNQLKFGRVIMKSGQQVYYYHNAGNG